MGVRRTARAADRADGAGLAVAEVGVRVIVKGLGARDGELERTGEAEEEEAEDVGTRGTRRGEVANTGGMRGEEGTVVTTAKEDEEEADERSVDEVAKFWIRDWMADEGMGLLKMLALAKTCWQGFDRGGVGCM